MYLCGLASHQAGARTFLFPVFASRHSEPWPARIRARTFLFPVYTVARTTMNREKAIANIQRHPGRTAVVMAVLTILIVVLIVKTKIYKAHLDECRGKNGFLTPGIGNFEIAGMNPLWWYGSAATGGLFANDPVTPQQMSVYEPRFRRSVQRRAALQKQLSQMATAAAKAAAKSPARKEGWHNPPCDSRREYQTVNDEGNEICLSPAESYGIGGCGAGWSPAAVAESQGLYVAQGLQGTPSPAAENRLKEAVNSVYNTQYGLTPAQITELAEYNQMPWI
jgi:hypothetical protein